MIKFAKIICIKSSNLRCIADLIWKRWDPPLTTKFHCYSSKCRLYIMKFRNTDAVSQIICSNKSSKWLLSPLSVMTNASFSTEPPWVPGFKQMKGKFAICQNLGRFFSFFKLNLSAFIWYALIIFLVSYWIKWKAENRIDASDKTELKPSPYFHWLVESAWDMYILTIAFLFFRDF